jgi:hypothetical protein
MERREMSEPITITATVAAWLSNNRNPVDLIDAIERGDYRDAVQQICITTSDMKSLGWTHVGDAEVTLHMLPRDEAVAKAVEGLQQKLAEEKAENHKRRQAILAQISKLQALTYEVSA